MDVLAVVMYVALAIYLIVEAESLGQYRGLMRMHRVATSTPGCMIRFFGCAILAAFPAAAVGSALGLWWVGAIIGLMVATGVFVLANRLLPL